MSWRDRVHPWKLQVTLARLGLTRQRAAELVGLTPDQFRDVAINGRAPPPAGFRASLENALGLEPGELGDSDA